jgi:hypothetical protein
MLETVAQVLHRILPALALFMLVAVAVGPPPVVWVVLGVVE